MQTERFIQSFKAALIGVLFSLFFAFALALIVWIFGMGESARLVVAQSLKGLSLAIGCMLVLRGEDGWKKGALAGLIFTLLTYVSFSGIGGFSWSWKILLDLALGLSVGVLSGIAAVNFRQAA